MKHLRIASLALAGTLALTACMDEGTSPTMTSGPSLDRKPSAPATAAEPVRHTVVFGDLAVPADFAARVAALGGSVAAAYPQLGVAFVSGLSDEAAAGLSGASGVKHVEREAVIERDALPLAVTTAEAGTGITSAKGGKPTAIATPVASPTDPAAARYYAFQWNMRRVGADRAWAAGNLGSSEVTVAILDTGLDYSNPDLAGRVDLSRSISMLPEEDAALRQYFPGAHPIADLHYHGTHVGSTVASNGAIAAGVTSQVTLIGVKVCRSEVPGLTGRGCPSSAIFGGLVHAVESGADVINMSLGGLFTKAANPGYVAVVNRVINYVHANNVTLVVAAGNDNTDLDLELYPDPETGEIGKYPSLYATYCNASHVICVSATGPASSANSQTGPWNDQDAKAAYSNFGRSAINVAAPGGTGAGRIWASCPTMSLYLRAAGFEADYCRTRPLGLGGTSMASPHTAGLAALMVQRYGRNPGAVKNAIQQAADDLGQSGTDPIYGKGRINVARAVGLK